jgi:hypothetical protein
MDHDLWLRLFPLARKYVFVPETLACMTAHADAKSFRQTREQFREVRQIKRRYRSRFTLTLRDRLMLAYGDLKNRVYLMLVRSGLWRPAVLRSK